MLKRALVVGILLTVATPATARHHWHYRHHHHRMHRHYRHAFRVHHGSALHSSSSHDLIVSRALAMGISRPVIEHVARKESGFRCSPPGHYNGPLQILASTARAFGFHGGSLNNCGAGLHFGLMHLKMCVGRYGNNPYAVAACHARGS